MLAIAPTPALGRLLSLAKISSALKRGGRQRRIEQRAVEIQTRLRSEQLAAPTGTEPYWGIPTSHYASVQLACTATVTDDADQIRSYLADQLATMQPDQTYGNPRDPDAPYTTELRQIRGLELHIDDIRAKFKFDGAEPDDVRRQVVDGYRNRNAPGDAEALEHLLRRHPPAGFDTAG